MWSRFEQLSPRRAKKYIKGFSTADFLHLGFNEISESCCSNIVHSQGFEYNNISNVVQAEIHAKDGTISEGLPGK